MDGFYHGSENNNPSGLRCRSAIQKKMQKNKGNEKGAFMLNEILSRFFNNAEKFLMEKIKAIRICIYMFSVIAIPVCINNISKSWKQVSMGGLLFVVLINLLLLAHDAHIADGGGEREGGG